MSLIFDISTYTVENVHPLGGWLSGVGIIFLGMWSNHPYNYHSINCIFKSLILYFSFRKPNGFLRLYDPPISGVYHFLNIVFMGYLLISFSCIRVFCVVTHICYIFWLIMFCYVVPPNYYSFPLYQVLLCISSFTCRLDVPVDEQT